MDKHSSVRLSSSPSPKFNYKALVAGLIVALGGGIAAYFILGRGEGETAGGAEVNKPSQIAEVEAAKAKPAEEDKPKKYADLSREEKLAYYRNKYGDNLPENLKPIVYYLENPPQRNFTPPKRPESIFKRHSERTIAAFLNVEPGTWMMKPVEFGPKFDADFAAAMNEEIEIADTDTDEQRALKQAVIDTKAELAGRVKNGEKASDIMTETSRQMYELGQYKRDIEEQVAAIRRDEKYSDEDLADYVEAANKMLEKKGLKPLRMPNMVLRHVGLKQRAKRAAQKAKEEESK